jgi:GAF domain-containing protein
MVMELPPEGLRSRIEAVNRVLQSQRTLPAKLEALAEVLPRIVTGCDTVSMALVVEGRARTGAVSTQLAVEADLVQYRQQEGPCLTAVSTDRTVRVDVLRQDERFEHFAPGAIEYGVESVLSVPLRWAGDVVGSINMYSRSPQAFDDGTEAVVEPIARYAAELIGRSPVYAYSLELMDELAAEVYRQDVVATALGILMALSHCDEAEAWRMLHDVPGGEDDSVVEAAELVIDSLGAQIHAPEEPPEGETPNRG